MAELPTEHSWVTELNKKPTTVGAARTKRRCQLNLEIATDTLHATHLQYDPLCTKNMQFAHSLRKVLVK